MGRSSGSDQGRRGLVTPAPAGNRPAIRGNDNGTMRNLGLGLLVSAASVMTAQPQRPNIVVIMADDIRFWNISAYNLRSDSFERAQHEAGD